MVRVKATNCDSVEPKYSRILSGITVTRKLELSDPYEMEFPIFGEQKIMAYANDQRLVCLIIKMDAPASSMTTNREVSVVRRDLVMLVTTEAGEATIEWIYVPGKYNNVSVGDEWKLFNNVDTDRLHPQLLKVNQEIFDDLKSLSHKEGIPTAGYKGTFGSMPVYFALHGIISSYINGTCYEESSKEILWGHVEIFVREVIRYNVVIEQEEMYSFAYEDVKDQHYVGCVVDIREAMIVYILDLNTDVKGAVLPTVRKDIGMHIIQYLRFKTDKRDKGKLPKDYITPYIARNDLKLPMSDVKSIFTSLDNMYRQTL